MTVSLASFALSVLDPELPIPTGLINPCGRPAGRRFDVYRNNVAVGLTEALEQAFPVIRKLVGAANFRILAGAYLRAHPPETPLMMHYGTAMPGFLADFPPVRSLGYLPDVARLELALRRSYHAADHAPIATDALQGLSPELLMKTRLSLAPSVEFLRSAWPIFGIWQFNTQPDASKPEARAEDILIVRQEFDPQPMLLSSGAAVFLQAVGSGLDLGAALDAALDVAPEFDLSPLLATLFAAGAFTAPKDGPTS